jgi:hypothetical protein
MPPRITNAYVVDINVNASKLEDFETLGTVKVTLGTVRVTLGTVRSGGH